MFENVKQGKASLTSETGRDLHTRLSARFADLARADWRTMDLYFGECSGLDEERATFLASSEEIFRDLLEVTFSVLKAAFDPAADPGTHLGMKFFEKNQNILSIFWMDRFRNAIISIAHQGVNVPECCTMLGILGASHQEFFRQKEILASKRMPEWKAF